MVSNQKERPLWGKATCEMSAESLAEGQQHKKKKGKEAEQ